jgi:diguanylate cyclase (GGDEF)-like protein
MGSFRARTLVLLIVLVLAVQAITAFTLLVQANARAREQAHAELRSGGRVLNALLRTRAEQIQQAVGVLVADYGFKEAVALGDRDTLVSALQNSASRVDARLAALIDLEGSIIAATLPRIIAPHGRDLAGVVAKSRTDTPAMIYETLGDTPHLLVATPVRAPEPIGSVVIGFPVDAQLALRLSDLLGYDVGFYDSSSDAPLIASTPEGVRRALGAQLSDQHGRLDEPTTMRLATGSYVTWTTPLSESSSLWLVLYRPLEDAMADYAHLRTIIVIVALAAMLASVPLANVLARGISRPLEQLVSAARRIQSGDYSARVELEATREFVDVARTLNTMQHHIAEREARIREQATIDDLTRLPNRLSAAQHLQVALPATRARAGVLSLLQLDLTNLDRIRASFGEDIADTVLREIARRLVSFAGTGDQVSRVGQSEFLIIAQGIEGEAALVLAKRLIQSVRSGLICNGVPINLDARVGIGVFPVHADQPAELLRRADTALFIAKEQALPAALYDPAQDDKHRRQLAILGDLRRATGANELSLHFQPKIDMRTRTVQSLEALVRWAHPVHGALPPAEFIPLAERTGNITLVTNWVIRAALRQMQEWREIGFELDVSINLSASDLIDPELELTILHHAREFGVRPQRLTFEITESAVMRETEHVVVTMQRLRKHGFRFSVDDFGTGYSSLAQFKRLPVDEIKIDKSFVKDLEPGSHDAVIVRSTIDLGHNLGVKTVAEGVETPTAWRVLLGLGCDLAQGEIVSMPLPAAEVPARVKQLNEGLVVAESPTQQLKVLRFDKSA